MCIGKYVNATTKVMHKCKIDGYEWTTKPTVILSGCGCPKCSGYAMKDHAKYVNEVKEINPDLEVVGSYMGARIPIKHRCIIHNYIWEAQPSMILVGHGCPLCNESRGERKVRIWLQRHNIFYEFQKTFDDCRDERLLHFDFYLPDMRTVIEYDGEQHYQPIKHFGGEDQFKEILKRDEIKDKFCSDNNIRMIRISYKDDCDEVLSDLLA